MLVIPAVVRDIWTCEEDNGLHWLHLNLYPLVIQDLLSLYHLSRFAQSALCTFFNYCIPNLEVDHSLTTTYPDDFLLLVHTSTIVVDDDGVRWLPTVNLYTDSPHFLLVWLFGPCSRLSTLQHRLGLHPTRVLYFSWTHSQAVLHLRPHVGLRILLSHAFTSGDYTVVLWINMLQALYIKKAHIWMWVICILGTYAVGGTAHVLYVRFSNSSIMATCRFPSSMHDSHSHYCSDSNMYELFRTGLHNTKWTGSAMWWQ